MDEIGAGLATGVLMFSTVAAEIVTPALVARFGYRLVLAAGLMLLGAPALALTASRGLTAILVVCALRGLGFAMVVVVGSALVASLVPHERRAEGLGIYGVVVGAPGVAALPLGVRLGAHAGYPPVFVAGAVASLAGLALVPGLPGRLGVGGRSDLPPLPRAGLTEPQRALGILAGLRRPALVRPAIVFSATAVAAGVIVTFLPLAVTGPSSGGLAVAALLAQAAAATLARW